MKKKLSDIVINCVVVVAIIVLIVAVIVVQPYMESRTYNKLTGANTTWWDAAWVQLRVQDRAKGEDGIERKEQR